MKKLLLFIVLLTFGLTTETFAQDAPTQMPPNREEQSKDPAAMVANQVERLKDALKLTPDQEEQITAIMTQSMEKMVELRKSGDRKAMREQRKVLRDEQDTAIEALLDKKQLKRYQNYIARRNERGPRRGGGPGGGRPGPDGGR